jgi:hypothetical protein
VNFALQNINEIMGVKFGVNNLRIILDAMPMGRAG